jgi:hypothetical protein
LKYPNVVLYNPIKKEEMKVEDPEYYLFEKIFRGDPSDNIRNIYPRLRKTKIQKAYEDPAFRLELLSTEITLPHIDKPVMVNDLFEENKLLIDLDQQPEPVKNKMYKQVDKIVKKIASPSRFQVYKFNALCKKIGLPSLLERIDVFFPLLKGR